MKTRVTTFGFDHGEPPEADHVYDVRSLHYNEDEWERAGQDIASECKPGESVAIGCKHGHTRSVHVAKVVEDELGSDAVSVTHRDKEKIMPLMSGSSDDVRSANISELRKSGYPEKQAIAIAYSKQREGKKKHGKKAKKPEKK